MMLTRENGEPLEPLEGPLDRAERERDEARAKCDALANALRAIRTMHWSDEPHHDGRDSAEAIFDAQSIAHKTLAALEEES